jgi:uncharacterized membrane protein YhaH (DUF805 family)
MITTTTTEKGLKRIIFYYQNAWRRFGDFDGRSARTEFLIFWFGNFLIIFLLTIFDVFFGWFSANVGLGILSGLFSLASIGPSWAAFIRRIHDSGHTGWLSVSTFIPLVGWLALLVLALLKGQEGENKYGVNPRVGYSSELVEE